MAVWADIAPGEGPIMDPRQEWLDRIADWQALVDTDAPREEIRAAHKAVVLAWGRLLKGSNDGQC